MPKTTEKSPVEFIRPEVVKASAHWERIRAACEGEAAVKALGDRVLPRPNAADSSAENQARYNAYLGRAVFYNATGRTLSGLVGYVFAKEPKITIPETLNVLKDNVDGSGITLVQQAKEALRLSLSFGRAGLLVDYPKTSQPTTKQDLLDGNVAPTIVLYEPEQIVNWRTSVVGSKTFIDLVVLKECRVVPDADDEFELKSETVYRVLTRTKEGVLGRIFRQQEEGDDYEADPALEYKPTNSGGVALKEIPFQFIGSENNDSSMDSPPLLDLANLNLAHFRNSADYEEACFLVGQPTPYAAGLTQQWVDDVLKGQIMLGSRALIPLPTGGTAGLLQATANSMPKEAMDHKELQMVALGAKLVQKQDVQRTATEASMEQASEVSTLTSCAQNVFLAYKAALKFAGDFVGTDATNIEFELSEPLSMTSVSADQATAILSLFTGGLIDFEEARRQLKRSSIAWKDDGDIKENVDAGNFDTQPPKPPTVPPVAP